jgi:hypothetical protein
VLVGQEAVLERRGEGMLGCESIIRNEDLGVEAVA